MTNEQIWQATLGELELTLSKANFTTWFKNTFIVSKKRGEFVIGVPNAFTKEWLQNKYHKNISRALQSITSERVAEAMGWSPNAGIGDIYALKQNINNTTAEEVRTQPVVELKESETAEKQGSKKLNPRYTFDNFVVGPNN